MALSAQDDFHPLPSTGTDLALKLSDLEINELPTGFEGSMSNLTLTDVIQLEGQNHFSGSVLVVFQEQEGQIFFQQGEVVHAEAGSHSGEDAFYRIIGWPGGSFKLHPNVSSLHRTVHKRREHLLLMAHQWLDESRQGQGPHPTHAALRQPATPGQPRDILQVIGQVPGVLQVVTMDKDGTPRGEVGVRGAALAAKGLYLATRIGAPIGEALGLGELTVAAMHAGPEKVLLLKSRGTYLALQLAPEASPEAVELGIRQTLAALKASR